MVIYGSRIIFKQIYFHGKNQIVSKYGASPKMTFAETMAILGAYEKRPKKEMCILEISEASE